MIIEPNTTIAERYTILEKIGVGGMAVVYKAKDEKLNRFVTFKVLKEEHIENDEFKNRFAVEAQAAARLSHPNIVNVYDVGTEGNIHYIVMEYIDGITLKELINKKAPFDNQEALSVAIQIASALEEAHKNNIVHRDIKPHNILVTREGDIKVTDFGIARAATSTTVTVESMGSVHYFSPEQARGGFVDAKSDIYSLGIVLFEMVTGRLPFQGDTPVALAMKHLREPIPDARKINPDVSESVYKIIIKATQKSSSKRYQGIEDMNKDLKRATKNETGDFVVFEEEDVTSQTIRVTGEELDEIKKQSKNIDSDYDDYDEYENYGIYKAKNNKTYYEKKKDRQVVFAAIGTALALIVLITVITLVFIVPKEDDVVVPDFINKTWDEALKLAEENQIYIKPDNENPEEYSDTIEKDHISNQNVLKGDTVKIGDTIYLVMSLGSDKIKVPNVVGHSLDYATAEFKEKNIKWKEEYDYNDSVEKDNVIRQDPEAGEEMSIDSKVTIYISRGKESEAVSVPDVVGYTEAVAKRELLRAGFEVDVRTVNSGRSEGQVVDQDFRDEKRETGTQVTIYVSNGKSDDDDDDGDEPDDRSPEAVNEAQNSNNPDENENNNNNNGEDLNADNNNENSENSNPHNAYENPQNNPENNDNVGDSNSSDNNEKPNDNNAANGSNSDIPSGGNENAVSPNGTQTSPNVDDVVIDPGAVSQ